MMDLTLAMLLEPYPHTLRSRLGSEENPKDKLIESQDRLIEAQNGLINASAAESAELREIIAAKEKEVELLRDLLGLETRAALLRNKIQSDDEDSTSAI